MGKITRNVAMVAVVMAFTTLVSADIQIVKDGKPSSEIVIKENPPSSVKMAAEDFQNHIELISKAKIPIVTTPNPEVKNKIYLGESDYTKKLGVNLEDIKGSGYKIVVKDNYAVLAGKDIQHIPSSMDQKKWEELTGDKSQKPGFDGGRYCKELDIRINDDTGTFYATSEILEQLGVRWYMPYENGTVIPEKKDIILKDQNIKKESSYKQRETTFYGYHLRQKESLLWLKHLKYGNAVQIDNNPHGTRSILVSKEQQQAHPEYYAMADGKMIHLQDGGRPKLTNPAFRKASINYAEKAFQACHELLNISLGMPDGFTQMDEEDAKLFPPKEKREARFSEYVWDYWLWCAGELKRKCPDKYLSLLSYTTYQDLPDNVKKIPDNIMIGMVIVTGNVMVVPHLRSYFLDMRQQWVKRFSQGTKLQLYDHFLFHGNCYRWPHYPIFFFKLLQEEMQTVEKYTEARFIESETVCLGLNHMTNYWQAKLLWDPNADRNAIFNEYYKLFYGPAEAEMKEFYEFAESVWMRPESRSVTQTSGFLKEKDVDRYFEILARARAKAGKGTVYDKRIEQIENEMSSLKNYFPNLKRSGPQLQLVRSDLPVKIDGDFNKKMWDTSYYWYQMKDLVTGEPLKQNNTYVSFRLADNSSKLLIAVKCKESKMDKIKAKITKNDDPAIFEDDVVEIYIETPDRSYFKIVVNANGAVYDESMDTTIIARDTLPILWNPGIKAAVQKQSDEWDLEIMIPVKDLGTLVSKEIPWGVNVCRSRHADGTPEYSAISPTGKPSFGILAKLGNLKF